MSEAILRYVPIREGSSNSPSRITLILDLGYAVTSHSSQGQTADRVLIHADTEESAPPR